MLCLVRTWGRTTGAPGLPNRKGFGQMNELEKAPLNEPVIRMAFELADQALSQAVLELWRHRRGPSDDVAKSDINDARRTLDAVKVRLGVAQ